MAEGGEDNFCGNDSDDSEVSLSLDSDADETSEDGRQPCHTLLNQW